MTPAGNPSRLRNLLPGFAQSPAPAAAGGLPSAALIGRKLTVVGARRLRSLRWMMAEADREATMAPDTTLDATGLLCPLPVLKARRALKAMPAGGILEVLATDPGATKDFEHFCRTTGCELIEASEQPGGILRFRLRKPA
jgi:tRNA 2-thiouridine synthesizing protein A